MYYTYLVGWKKYNIWYYGARWANDAHPNDLWVSYFTSSFEVGTTRQYCGEPDVIEIRKTFSNKQKCRKWEHVVLRRMKVVTHKYWLNKTTATGPPIATTGMHSEEFKRKLAERNSKRVWTSESREKLRIAGIKNKQNLPSRKGSTMSEEAKKKISLALKGVSKPEGHGEKVSKAMMGNTRGKNRNHLGQFDS